MRMDVTMQKIKNIVIGMSLVSVFVIDAAKIQYTNADPIKDSDAIMLLMRDGYEIDRTIKHLYEEKIKKLENSVEDIIDVKQLEVAEDDLVMFVDGKIAGFSSFDFNHDTKNGRIYMFLIAKQYRGLGFGKNLLESVIGIMEDEGMESVSLAAHPVTNSAAILLYKKLGFQEVGQKKNLLDFSKKLNKE